MMIMMMMMMIVGPIDGMGIGKGNQSTPRKTASVPL
jgi:hypothetical protein